MILIERPQKDPYFNIAAEEYVLKNFSEDVLMLWQSEASVIVGKHQNAIAEVNLNFVGQHKIPVIRRISGGGTVYHDLGNINYTVITSESKRERLIDFKKFTQPILEFIATLGVKASYEGKNNLVTDGKKFSGNSAHVFKNRVMHHGTLLFNTDLDQLDESIRPVNINIQDKAVQSIRATVTNLHTLLDQKMSADEFKVKLQKYIFKYHHIKEIHDLSNDDINQINDLVSEKYKRWKWNFGYSPKYTFSNAVSDLNLKLEVKNGLIEFAKISSDRLEIDALAGGLFIGLLHDEPGIREKLSELQIPYKLTNTYLKLFGF